jgi:hypothetical protein
MMYTEEFSLLEVSLTTQQECAPSTVSTSTYPGNDAALATITRSRRSIADFLLEQCPWHSSTNVSGDERSQKNLKGVEKNQVMSGHQTLVTK